MTVQRRQRLQPAIGDQFHDCALDALRLSVFDTLDKAIITCCRRPAAPAMQIAQATPDRPARHRFGRWARCRRARALVGGGAEPDRTTRPAGWTTRSWRARRERIATPKISTWSARFDLSEQAKRLRCRAEVVFRWCSGYRCSSTSSGGLTECLRRAGRRDPRPGGAGLLHRSSTATARVAATRLTVFPLQARRRASDAARSCCTPVGDVWPANGGQVLARTSPAKPAAGPAGARQPASNVMVECRPSWPADPANVDVRSCACTTDGNTLLLKGRPRLPELPREVLPCFKYSIIDLADDRRVGEARQRRRPA